MLRAARRARDGARRRGRDTISGRDTETNEFLSF